MVKAVKKRNDDVHHALIVLPGYATESQGELRLHPKCEERAREFSQDPNATGYLVDDRVYNAFHHLYSAFNEVHKQITSLR